MTTDEANQIKATIQPIKDDILPSKDDVTTIHVPASAARRAFLKKEAVFAKKQEKLRRVSMAGRRRFTRAEMKDSHRSALRARRHRQITREVGLIPTPNVAINNAFNAAYVAFLNSGMRPVDAHNEAWRKVARSLPLGREVKRFGLNGSKQETVEGYVKANVAKALRTA